MQRARQLDQGAGDRQADASASRSTPLTIVSGAVAGDDLERVAGAASDALGRPIAIALPALGNPVVWPAGAIGQLELRGILDYAAAIARGAVVERPPSIGQAVPIRIGREVVGIVATAATRPTGAEDHADDRRAWLEAAAAAAAVATLMHD